MDPHDPESLSLYLDGELDPAGRASVEEHLAACAACRATLEAFTKVRELLRAEAAPAPTDELAQRRALREILRSRAPEPLWRRPVVVPAPGFAALVAALVVAFGTLVFDRLPPGRKIVEAKEETPEAREAPPTLASGGSHSSLGSLDPESFDGGGRMEIFVASHSLPGEY